MVKILPILKKERIRGEAEKMWVPPGPNEGPALCATPGISETFGHSSPQMDLREAGRPQRSLHLASRSRRNV